MTSVFFDTAFSTERLLQTGDKSAYADFGSGFGYLCQTDDRMNQTNNLAFGEAWELTVDIDVDVIVTDRVLIGSEKYEVRGIKSESFNAIRHKKILLVKKKP